MKIKSKLFILVIFLIAVFFRLYNVNWDQGQHLHPDERFLTMVGNAMKTPSSLAEYFNPQTSLFNPSNIGYPFYVYGTFPVILNKLLALLFSTDTYNSFTIQGRILSAFFDILTLFIIFKILILIKKYRDIPEQIIYLGPLFYALFTLPIQLSHFFAVDTFFNFFLLTSFYFGLKYYYETRLFHIFWSALFLALSTASKPNAIILLPLLVFYFISVHKKDPAEIKKWTTNISRLFHLKKTTHITLISSFVSLFIFGVIFYLILRLAGPYYFADSNIFHLTPNPLFMENMKTLKYYMSSEAQFPPSVQWAHTFPITFSLYNIAVWGVGILPFLFMIAGSIVIMRKYKYPEITIAFLWVWLFFLYQSVQFVKTMRYFIILYPFIAILCAFGFYYLLKNTHNAIKILSITMLFIWPLCFLSIYIQPVSRIAASHWIIQHVPPTSTILTEHWDDSLPLPVNGVMYPTEQLPVFDPDNEDKWNKMRSLLERGDYLILSSNRGWGSIQKVPERYPLMSKFYKDLFDGKLEYKLIKEFSSYPSLSYMGIPITFPDDGADEAFTVYDHPKVMIFQKQK